MSEKLQRATPGYRPLLPGSEYRAARWERKGLRRPGATVLAHRQSLCSSRLPPLAALMHLSIYQHTQSGPAFLVSCQTRYKDRQGMQCGEFGQRAHLRGTWRGRPCAACRASCRRRPAWQAWRPHRRLPPYLPKRTPPGPTVHQPPSPAHPMPHVIPHFSRPLPEDRITIWHAIQQSQAFCGNRSDTIPPLQKS